MKIVRAIATRGGWAAVWYGTAAADDGERLARLEAQIQTLQQQVHDLQTTVQTLQSQMPIPGAMAASELDPFVSVVPGPLNGLKGPHVIFTGANVHIRSGSGNTEDTSGLGNLLIGYDEALGDATIDANRTGSHNVIIGQGHQFTASAGFVVGLRNTISGQFSSVSGGKDNTASGEGSSVSGGVGNTASGEACSVSGGGNNTAGGNASSVSGGSGNTASGERSSVSGGSSNKASSAVSSVSGGRINTAGGKSSSVSGGFSNTARGRGSSVSTGSGQNID